MSFTLSFYSRFIISILFMTYFLHSAYHLCCIFLFLFMSSDYVIFIRNQINKCCYFILSPVIVRYIQPERYADVALVQLAQVIIRSGNSYNDYLSDAAVLLNSAMRIDPNEVCSYPFAFFTLAILAIIQFLCLVIIVIKNFIICNCLTGKFYFEAELRNEDYLY